MSGVAEYSRHRDFDEPWPVSHDDSPNVPAHSAADDETDWSDQDDEEDGRPPPSLSIRARRWMRSVESDMRAQYASLRKWLRTLWIGEKLAVQYLVADTRRELKGVCIGIFTVLLVVMLVSLLENSVQRSPIIFWKIAETSVGETDLMLTAGYGVSNVKSLQGETTGGITNMLVHQTFIEKQVEGLKEVRGSTGRWMLLARVLAGNNSATTPPRGINATAPRVASGYLLGIDSVREDAIGLGRSWDYPPLVGAEAYLSRSMIREIGMDPASSVGQKVMLRIDLLAVAQTLNVGGIGGGADTPDSGGGNVPNPDNPSLPPDEQNAYDDSEGSWASEEQQTQLLRQLVQLALPSLADKWDTPVDLGPNKPVVVAFLSWLNYTAWQVEEAGNGEGGSLFPPVPALPPWQPGQPIPPELQPLLDTLAEQYGLILTPDQLEQLLQALLANANVLPLPFPWPSNSSDIDPSSYITPSTLLLFDPVQLSWHLARLRADNETYGDLFDLVSPFLLDLLRLDAPFTVAGVVDEPEGKWSEALGSVIVLESRELEHLVAAGIDKVLRLQGKINMSADIVWPVVPPIVPGQPVPLPPDGTPTWPLERLIRFLFPSFNSSSISPAFDSLAQVGQVIQSGNLSLFSVVQYSGRLGVYLKTLDEMNRDLVTFTDVVSGAGVGFDYPLTYTLPIAQALATTEFVRYFLDNVFGAVVFLLVLLGALLVYSLLLNDVDARTYEYGMLRALGLTKRNLVQLLLSKSVLFSVPGVGLGLFLAFLANIPVAIFLARYASVDPVYSFFALPVLVATALGVLIPLVANLVPIGRALGKTLRDSLDVYHVVVSEVAVRMIKLENLGVDLWQTSLSMLIIGVGFTAFYVVPYAFVFKQYPLFLAILNGILLAMLLGLCIVAQILQPTVELLVLRLSLWCIWPHRKLYSVVEKNLGAHKGRNTKTAQMFLICLSFLVFAGTMFNLQAAAMGDNLRVFAGADIQVFAPLKQPGKYHLAEAEMRKLLQDKKDRRAAGDRNEVVEDFTFVSYALNNLVPVNRVGFSTLPEMTVIRNLVWGVEANFLNVAYADYMRYSNDEVDAGSIKDEALPRTRHGDVDIVRLMVEDAGGAVLPEERARGRRLPADLSSAPWDLSILSTPNATEAQGAVDRSYASYLDVLVSQALAGSQSVSLGTPLHLAIHSHNNDKDFNSDYLCKARALVIKMPGFLFSSYSQTAKLASILVGMEQFERVMRDVYGDWPAPPVAPKQKLFVRVAEDATRDQREDVINALRTYFKGDLYQVLDTRSILTTMDRAVGLMDLFFTMTGAIAMIMCFFLLYLSFTANVEENGWEFGVLRAVGLNSVEVVMVYIYEAVALVLASVLLGTSIGVAIAATLTLQFNLFTELPFVMKFPATLFTSMVVMAIAVAIGGSALPAYKLLKKSISTVLRRQ